MKYKILLQIEDEEEYIVTSQREHKWFDVEGIARIGWCIGNAIADAIFGLENYIPQEDLQNIFDSIVSRANEEGIST